MITSKFFKDLENIRTWADEEVLRSHNTDSTFNDVHQSAATCLQEWTDKLYEFYYDPETYSYKYPTDEELEADESKKADFENLEMYYQNFINSADALFDFVKEEDEKAKKKNEKLSFAIPSQFKILYSYAKRDLWARFDQKEKNPLLEKSELLKKARRTMDAPANMQELAAMEQQISNLINEAKEISKDEYTFDEAPEEVKEETSIEEEASIQEDAQPKVEEAITVEVTEEELENLFAEKLQTLDDDSLRLLTEEEFSWLSPEKKKERLEKEKKIKEEIKKELIEARIEQEKQNREAQKQEAESARTVGATIENETKNSIEQEKEAQKSQEAEEAKLREELRDEAKRVAEQLKEDEQRAREQEEEKERKLREEAEQKDKDAIAAANEKADKVLQQDMDELLKQMQKAEKTIIHTNTKEFDAMRDRLYDLAKCIKDIKQKTKPNEELDQTTKETLQKSIDDLNEATDEYITAKGMGRQWSTMGKRRINLAYSIGDYLTRVRETSLEKYAALEQAELRRLEYEEKNREKLEKIRAEEAKLKQYQDNSPIYGKILYEMDKVVELYNVPEESFFQKKFKEDLEKYKTLMEKGTDIGAVKVAREALRESRILLMRDDSFDDIEPEVKQAIRKLDISIPNTEKNVNIDVENYRKNPDFFKERLKEHQHIFERLGEMENLPLKVKNFVQEYNNFINETEADKLKPEYMQLRLNYLNKSVWDVANAIKNEDITLYEDEDKQYMKMTADEVQGLLRFGFKAELRTMTDTLLGCSNAMIREAVDSSQYINDLFTEYKDVMEQFFTKCPEAAEARQWLNEELESGRNNSNRIGVMFGTKLRDLITMKNIEKYNIEIDGVDKSELPDLIGEIRQKMSLGSGFMISDHKEGARALKQQEDKKKINAQLQNVKKAYEGKPNHLSNLYQEMTRGILEINEGSSGYNNLLATHEKLGEYLLKNKNPLAYDAQVIVKSLRRDLGYLKTNKSIQNGEQIQDTLDKLHKDCEQELEVINTENARIQQEKREARIREEEAFQDSKYRYRGLKAQAKETFELLEKEGLLKDHEKEAGELQNALAKREIGSDKMLDLIIQSEEMVKKISAGEMSQTARESLEKFSKQLQTGIALNYRGRAERRLSSYLTNSEERKYEEKLKILDGMGFDTDYVNNLFDIDSKKENPYITTESNVWHSLKDHLYKSDSAYCIDHYMKNNGLTKEQLNPEFKMIKRLQDCRRAVDNLKSVDKIREIKPLTSEDMVHDIKLLEKAKFATKLLDKIQKIKGDDRKQFIINSTQSINNMMDDFEKFVDDKYKDKQIYFYKDKADTDIYKEWKTQQLERRSAAKNQEAVMTPKDLMQTIKLKERIQQGRRSIAKGIENRGLEEKAAIAEAMNIPTNGYFAKNLEIYERNLNVRAHDTAEAMHGLIGISQSIIRDTDSAVLKENNIKAALAAYNLYNQSDYGKEKPIDADNLYNMMADWKEIPFYARDVCKYCLNELHGGWNREKFMRSDTVKQLKTQKVDPQIMVNFNAYIGSVEALVSNPNLSFPSVMYIGEIAKQYQDERKGIKKFPKAVDTIVNLQRMIKEGRITDNPVIDAVYDNRVATIGECRDTYRRMITTQYANHMLGNINDMSREKRISYLEKEGGKEHIDAQLQRLEAFIDKNMPAYLNAENEWKEDQVVMEKTMMLLSKDYLKEFLKEEKVLEDAQKAEAQKAEAAKAEAEKAKAEKAEAQKNEAVKEEAVKEEAVKEEPQKEEKEAEMGAEL